MSTISFSGLASGIDGDAVIKATLDAQRLAYKPLQASIDSNTRETKSLQEFNTKLLSLNDSLKEFLTLAGNGVSKSGTSGDSDVVGMTVSDSAPVSSSTISVQQLAKSATFSFTDKFASADALVAPNVSGTETLSVTVGTGDNAKTYSVDVTSSTKLSDIVNQLNGLGEGRISASAINKGTEANPEYALVIGTTDTGVAKGTISVSASSGLTSSGVFAGSAVDQAQDAIFTVSGIGQLTRSTNKISGIIQGVTFDLKQATNTPIQLTVADDREKTTQRFATIIGQINEIITYSKSNSTITRDETSKTEITNVFGDLAKTRIDDQAVQAIKDALGSALASDGSTVQTFADLGISTNRDGTIAFDPEKFTNGLGADSRGAGQLLNQFADKLGATGGVIDGYTRYQGTISTAISANDDQTKNLQDRINAIEDHLAKQQESLKILFSNLEQKISKLNSSGSALAGLSSTNSKG